MLVRDPEATRQIGTCMLRKPVMQAADMTPSASFIEVEWKIGSAFLILNFMAWAIDAHSTGGVFLSPCSIAAIPGLLA